MPALDYEHHEIETNGVKLHVVQAGPQEGPPVILLHGFPEFWYAWRQQIPHLAAAGFRVIVPDQRGYNLSEKPPDVAAYRIGTLARDITGLMDTLGYQQVRLVGHDWGGAVAWMIATMYPERLQQLALLNVPHPQVMARAFARRSQTQLRKSWYMFYFQLPHLPELSLRAGNWRALAWALRASSQPGTFSDEDLVHYRAAWSQPGAARGMLNWYRTMLKRPPRSEKSAPRGPLRIEVPTLMLWGERDAAFTKSLAEESIALCSSGRLVFFPQATHWVQHEEAPAVNQHLIDFFSAIE